MESAVQDAIQIGDEYEGECVSWNERVRYGFLRTPGLPDIFVGARELQNVDRLHRGDRVTFTLRMDRGGRLQGSYCTVLDDDLPAPTKDTPTTKRNGSVTLRRVETIFRDGRQIVIPREY